MGMTHKILFGFLLSACAVSAADFDVEALPEKLAGEVQKFFAADTGRARTQIAAFGDEDLQKITTAFKKAHPAAEQRLFWLIEESYRRNAERVAAERIRFLLWQCLPRSALLPSLQGSPMPARAIYRRLPLQRRQRRCPPCQRANLRAALPSKKPKKESENNERNHSRRWVGYPPLPGNPRHLEAADAHLR
jgi:hypothetical protein